MTLHLHIRRVEQVIFGDADPTFSGDQFDYTAFERRLRYRRLVAVSPMDPDAAPLLEVDDFTSEVRDLYRRVMASPGYIASGIFEFSDFCFFGACALPVDLPTSSCLIGSAFDWEQDFNRFYLNTSTAAGQCKTLSLHDASAEFSVELGSEHIHHIDAPSLILAHPGQSIYGHWLLDLLPRLYLLSQTKLHRGTEIYFAEVPRWAHVFLEAFDFSTAKFRSPLPGMTRYRQALMASSTKSGYRLGQPVMRDAWRHMKEFAQTSPNGLNPERRAYLPNAAKIFISREDWQHRRREIANIAEIQNIAVMNGYTVLQPEQYSPLEQAAIFRRARAIVGEDGSALHNIIFAEPGCILGVIGVPDRINLWHLGICHALEHKASYMQAKDDGIGQRTADVSIFRTMLRVIGENLSA